MFHIPSPPTDFNNQILPASAHADLPVNFDPNQYPILGRHWFDWRSVDELATNIVADIRTNREIGAQRSGI